jgi:hypothetical protein
MPLDLWIYGPGYGETIFMAWDDPAKAGNKRAAVVDHYGGPSETHSPIITKWKELGEPPLAFVAATHPHFDHLRNFHLALEDFARKEEDGAAPHLEKIFWWGGFDDALAESYYQAIVQRSPARARELTSAASMASRFLSHARTRAGHDGSGFGSKLLSLEARNPVERHGCGGVTVTAMGPWARPKKMFVAAFKNQFREIDKEAELQTVVEPDRVRANRISLGLLVEYGAAQIVLGGDMEEENWRLWRKANKQPLRPCVVKVSHHGSSTGTISGMWDGRGFFDSHNGETDTKAMPICVVTPWRRGAHLRQLPDNSVLQKIETAGCRLVVTGTPANSRGLDAGNLYCDSYVHIRVEDSGWATVEDSRLCRL